MLTTHHSLTDWMIIHLRGHVTSSRLAGPGRQWADTPEIMLLQTFFRGESYVEGAYAKPYQSKI